MDNLLSRVNFAIVFLQDRLPFRVGDLYMGVDEDDVLNVTGVSGSMSLENITKRSALSELSKVKCLFADLLSISDAFQRFVTTKEVQYNLNFDYGMGDIRVCCERDSVVVWHFQVRD